MFPSVAQHGLLGSGNVGNFFFFRGFWENNIEQCLVGVGRMISVTNRSKNKIP